MLIDNSKKYIKFLTSLIEHFKFQELTNETIDTYLDLRDQQPFDSDWSAMYNNLEKLNFKPVLTDAPAPARFQKLF